LAINGAQTRLYAANDAGSIDVYDCTFTPVNLGADAFVNPALPAGLVPFNVQEINGNVLRGLCARWPPRSAKRPVGGRGRGDLR
jgi:hypothetical protein